MKVIYEELPKNKFFGKEEYSIGFYFEYYFLLLLFKAARLATWLKGFFINNEISKEEEYKVFERI